MSVLGCTGFNALDFDRDGVVIVAGSPSYDTGELPPDGLSSASCLVTGDIVRRPFYNGEKAAPLNTPSGTNVWMHARFRMQTNSPSNNDNRFIGLADGTTEMFGVSFENTTAKFVIRVAGVIRATAAVAAFSEDTWERVHMTVDNQLGGVINVYQDGDTVTPIVTYTLIAADVTNLTGLTVNNLLVDGQAITGNFHVTDLVAIDPDDGVGGDINTLANLQEITIEAYPVDSDGFYTDWTGDYTDIDEIPASDSDSINTSTVDDASTFGHVATTQDKVLYVQSLWRVKRTGTDAGANMQIRMREGGADTDEATTTAPGDGDVIQPHHDGVGGAAWSPTEFNGTEFGPVART